MHMPESLQLQPPAPLESTEELREALLSLRRRHDALQRSSAQAQQLLDALESLLSLGVDDDPFARVFASLHLVFTFSQAMLLAEPEDAVAGGEAPQLACIVAEPAALQGAVWPVAALFRKVLAGRVATTFTSVDLPEWQGAAARGLSPVQSALYMPLRVRERRGILVLLRPAGGEPFDRGHVALARRFSVLVSHALATRYASQSAAESQRLRELTEQLRRSEQAARRNAQLLEETVNMLPMGVAVQDEEGRLLIANHLVAQALGEPIEALRNRPSFALLGGSSVDCERRRAAFTRHLDSGEQRSRERTVVIGAVPHTLLVTGKPVRILDERLLLSAMVDITERKLFEQELSRRAFHDALTGLPNRTLMQQIVDTAMRSHQRGGMFALAFIDLDNFKQVNDYYSHAIGDALLRAVAERITATIRPADTLARISGDEFLLLINPLDDEQYLPALINRVLDVLKQPFEIEGHRVLTSASVGASIYPLHGTTYEALQRCADSAMYRAKSDRKGSASYFDMAMGNALTARMALEQRLRAAIRERRLRAAFQPKLELASGAVRGFEALVRWVEPDGTVRLPGSFIELASELGLVDEITGFVLDDVLGHLPALVQRHGAHIGVSLNITARQAGDVPFMESVAHRLQASGLARHVVLELTEEALVATQRFQRHVLPQLRAMGVRVSIDDFGTGYSSLSMLADITADEVKVDRAFVTAIHERPRSQGILKAIESLCNALQIDMVAEGVETEAERQYLLAHTTIRQAQGFLFAEPQFIDRLVEPLPPAPAEEATPT
ncbi:putative bifunctional diguanylate cyclase/phosphodiesterase [Pseudorhodoferax sp.]|uniref:putative bifunctional diguanylate cyclase/phosphodiesterase n=1 Tax=Pseudorhodoferax sp. TaxID=1993553 RepID=UPI0039E525FC